jgi:hypothetical protein
VAIVMLTAEELLDGIDADAPRLLVSADSLTPQNCQGGPLDKPPAIR